MSRRKQSKPRPVKAVEEPEDIGSIPGLLADNHEDNDNNNAAVDDDDDVVINDKLVIALSPTVDDSRNSSNNSSTRQHHDSSSAMKVNHSVQILSSSSSLHIPPNFLLPSPTSAFSAPVAPFLPPPPSSSSPSTSSSLGPSLVEEMARRKRSPKNIHWHRQTESQTNTKAEKCQLCLAQMPDPKPPVEGEDYFIDNDGTLTIKNGVCPRSLALTLFSEVAVTRVKYEKLLGENLDKFLLNLKQIIEKHQEICPGEDPSDLINAQNVLKAYTTANIQKFPMSRKRTHEFISGGERNSLLENLQRNKMDLSDDVNSAVFPENFLHTPPSVTTPLQRSSSQKGKTSGVLSEPHSPMFSPSFPATKLDDSSSTPAKDVPSDAGSTGGSSRVSSPTPSLSSVTSGLGLSDAAKQMANTKRGSKILPVSTNGQTHYLCPVCSIELSSDHELTVHIRSHNQSSQQTAPNSCTICGKTLSSQSSLDRHMLVHSGERPFRCKICDMSFTTNGNMHRHARIHEKNGISTGHKPASRKQSEPKASSKDNLLFRQEKLLSGPPTGMGAAQRPSVTPDFGPEKMGLFTTPQQHHEQTAFLQQYYSMMFPYSAHHPAFPYHHLLQDPARMALPFYQAMLDPMSGKNPARRAMLPHQFLPPVREPSPDLRTQQKFTCSECNAVFNNQFALDSHMESHIIVDEELEAESGTACKKCKRVVKSEESLLLHHLTHHKVKEELAEPDTKPGQKSPTSSSPPSSSSAAATTATGSSSPTNSSGNNSKVTVGFQNLGFANFTSKKFPLIAKAYCESNPGLKGSKFPSFQCEKCEQVFPVEGAKNLHEASHVPEEYTVCPKCDCHFADSSRLQDHMRKHVADVKFEESNGKNCEEVAESMSQPYFLAQLGLVARDDNEDKNMIYDADDMDIIVKDDSVLSDNEDSKVANSLNSDIDEDNRSESSKISLTGEDKAANNSLSLPPSIFLHPNTAVPGSSNSNTPAVPPSMKPSQNLSEVSPNLLPNVLNSRSPTPSGDSDGDPSSRDSPIGVSDGSMPPMFPCKYCDMVLSSPRALKYHQRTHKDTSQFQCRVCNYSSTDKSTLLRHMRTHSGERPYKCVICDYSFTTKANCERHLRQKHDVDKDQLAEKLTCNKYIIANTKSSPTMLDREASGSQPKESLCKSCGIDFYTWRGLQQHLHVSPDCRTRYMCKICKTTVSSRQSLLHHMNKHHGDISAQQWEKYIVTVENPVGSPTSENKPVLSTPPPAHSKQTKSQIGSFSKAGLNFEQVVVKKKPNFAHFDNAEKSELAEKMDALLKQRNKERRGEMSVEKPLDFSKQQKLDACVSQLHQSLNLSRASSVSLSEDDQSLDEVPMDLTVSRPSLPSSWSKGQGHNLGSQSTYGFPRPVKEESRTSSKLRQIATNNNNNNSSKQNTPTNSKGSNIPFIVENPNQPRRSDGNNNQLSPLLGHVSSRNTAIVQQLSPARPTSGGSKPETSATSLSPHPAKHPAFPTFPIVSPYSTLLPPAGAASLAFQAHPALSAAAQKLAFLPNIHPSLLPSAIPQVGGTNVAFLSVNETAAKSRSQDKDTPDDAKNDLPKSGKSSASHKDTEGEDHKKRDVLEKNTSLKEADKDDKVKSSKESTCESDSSCELASVNKILDATDAQNFQEFLAIPETEDEDDNRSESVASGEDSNLSLENMYSNSQSLAAGTLARARLVDEAVEEGKEEGTKGTSVTVNMALIDNSIPEVIKEKVLREEAGYNDPSNMSEQAIAALIEKVSRENVNSPAKKKRNSYADSPHKFTCPYCPRCFPWLSSLNRHLLTHTGQKPFKCPRCPVTFSTKSNRERHLIRKHNVNMLDPASRSTMDRPYKCHLCVFSSFSTQSNLIKHYKDRHSDVSPPQHLLEAGDKALSDGEGEDGLLNGGASYEDEEEYNALAEMRGSLSDKEIMLQNYAQDSDSNHSGNSISSLRYPYRKRNAIFNINGEEEQINSSSNGSKMNGGNNLTNHSAAGIGNKNNSLNAYTKAASVPTTRPGIDDTVLTDTMKNFLDKSVRQALEDSHKRALEEGSKFIITPAIERHLRRLPNVDDAEFDLSTSQATQCSICDAQFSSHKLLVKHIKQEHSSEPPFKCYLCEMSFTSRVECLQHQAQSHQAVWNILKEKNEIGNVQVFSTRLDKRIEKLCKKGKDLLDKQEKEDLNGESDDLTTAADLDKSTAEVEKTSDNNTVEDLSDKSASKEKNEDNTNNDDNDDKADTSLLQDVVTTDYLQRKIHCAFCSKRFWSLQDLRRHMRSHTGEQPYKCDICSQKFTLKHSMNRHMAKHHAGVKDGSSGVDVGTDDEESESDAGKPRTRSSQKAVTSLVSKVKNISAAGENNINSSDKNNNNNISNGDNKKEDGNESDDDMLHNLLGVESSTIDQIFESKDSAASLLGV